MNDHDPRIAYFDDLACHWDDEEPSAETMTARLAGHAGLLALRPATELLEVGCGTGKTTVWLAQQVAPGRVTAIDFAPRMIEQARAKGIDADFACRDVCRDDLGTADFDTVLCFHCFPHFRDQAAALSRLAKALKPRGRLIIMHLAGSEHINGFHAGLDAPVSVDVLPSGDRWPPLLAAAGLECVRHIDRDDLFFLEAGRTPAEDA